MIVISIKNNIEQILLIYKFLILTTPSLICHIYYKGCEYMNFNVINPHRSFITNKPLKKTPISNESRKRSAFINSHTFYFHIDKDTKELISVVEENNQ